MSEIMNKIQYRVNYVFFNFVPNVKYTQIDVNTEKSHIPKQIFIRTRGSSSKYSWL